MADKNISSVLRSLIMKDEEVVAAKEKKLLENKEYVQLLKEHRELVKKCLFDNDGDVFFKIREIEEKISNIKKVSDEGLCCPKCGGKRLVSGRICDCTLPDIYKECYDALDVRSFKEDFNISNPDLFDSNVPVAKGRTQKELYLLIERKSKTYANDFPCCNPKNLLFIGGTGLGKTFLLRCIAKEIQKNFPVCFLSAASLERIFLKHRLAEPINLDYIYNAELLIIDDFGSEASHNNVTEAYMFELIEKRKGKSTIISTNFNLTNISDFYSERISSRLSDRTEWNVVTFQGCDIRSRKIKNG